MNDGHQLHQEILEQPDSLRRLLLAGRPAAEVAAARIAEFGPACMLVAARGTSDNAARYAQYLFGAQNKLSVGLALPSLITLYGAAPDMSRAVVLGVSQSGQSPDIVGVVNEARRQGAVTLSVTNEPASPLALAASLSLPLLAGEEQAVAATKTYTSQLCALAMLSAALTGDEARWEELLAVPALVEQTLRINQGGAHSAGFEQVRQLLVLGRGFNYATAFEIALKVKETSYVVAEPYSVADLLHGPVAMVERGFPVVVVAPSGATLPDARGVVRLLEGRGADLRVITDDEELLGGGRRGMRLPAGVPEWLSPMIAIVAGQLFALSLARAKGFNPDKPRGLEKVTLTL